MDSQCAQRIGLHRQESPETHAKLIHYLNLKLAALGLPGVKTADSTIFEEMAASLLSRSRESERLLADYLCPADQRIQDFLNAYLGGAEVPRLPRQTLVLDHYGLARALSLPPDADQFSSEIVNSYRLRQGILHNPKSDRRTTAGIFHVAEGGLPIPDDKKAVPKEVFGRLLRLALAPPAEYLRLPFTSTQPRQAECFVSLLIRPLLCPEVAGFIGEKTMEIRFFVPGNLVGNLDFIESIFGNAGDPFLPENDAGLDVEHWSGHTGCVILAPHTMRATKRELGLPSWDQATDRQKRDGMCWRDPGELYNDGSAFKLTARDERGVIVTIIADNYFGYCKKEVKTQLSYAANLFGLVEEEHAGGALVFPSYDLGEEFSGQLHVKSLGHTLPEAVALFPDIMAPQPEGHAVDRHYPDIIYVPEDSLFDLQKQSVSWLMPDGLRLIKLLPDKVYVRPSGYQVRMVKSRSHGPWQLIGTVAEGTLCHKPCTVSGGGKSEISKPISDAIIQGPIYVADFQAEFDLLKQLIRKDYSDRFANPNRRGKDRRPILSPERSLGSVIKLLTPDAKEFSAEYNDWLESIPQHVKELLFVVKRFYQPNWGEHWEKKFSVDIINGLPGNELKFLNRKLQAHFLRVGFDAHGAWRVFGLRKDFHPAHKIQVEDDITASVVAPARRLANLPPECAHPSVKFVQNCEYRLFQRPDDAIHRGYDRQTELDFTRPGNFLSNFEPLTPAAAREMIEDTIGFDQFTKPMQDFIRDYAAAGTPSYFACSANPRLVDGKPSKNPRYLQTRPDLLMPREVYLADICARLFRRVPMDRPLHTPVTVVVPGRRNNPPERAAGIRCLAVFNPIHYLELPELFMEFICSMTGKSPSTTGAGSEGALTKGPFNALPPIYDLNNALVGYLLTGYEAFVTAAAYVGPKGRVDHDISLLVPEILARMTAQERNPRWLISHGYLERCRDTTHEGAPVLASRLGWRITREFVHHFFGRVFNHPHIVISDEMLRPETQDPALFAEGVDNIIATQRRVAAHYFNDGSVEQACPPLKALLHIMAHDQYEGRGLEAPEIRTLFTHEQLLASDWYRARLQSRQSFEQALCQRGIRYLESFLARETYAQEAERLGIRRRLESLRRHSARVQSPAYLDELQGTIGRELIPV